MGGERASTTRQRENGKICCKCHVPLGPPPAGYRPGPFTGERFCQRCEPRLNIVQMRFERCFEQWRVTCSDRTGQIRQLTFDSADKVEEMAERGGAFRCLADRQAVEHALRTKPWLGIAELRLTDEQYRKLKR